MNVDKHSNDLPRLIQEYLFYMQTIRGRSIRTIDGYALDLRLFFRFLKKHRGLVSMDLPDSEIKIANIDETFIQSVTLMDVYEFLNHTMRNRNNGAKTRSRKISSLRGFFKYLMTHTQLLSENPLDHLESPSIRKSLPKYMTVQQCVELLDTAAQRNSKTKLRDYCILTLFLNCGMRLSELAGIRLSDFDLKTGSLRILGKGNKERVIYLNEACKDSIQAYLKERNQLKQIVDKNYLFLASRTGKQLQARAIQLMVQNILREAGMDTMGFSVHKLRHTAATLLYQHGQVDILLLKELLGHVNVGTTEIYTHVANEKVKESVDKNPLASKKVPKNQKNREK